MIIRTTTAVFLAVVVFVLTPAIAKAQSIAEPYSGITKVSIGSDEGCFELKNATTRVVLGHHRGGRVLIYERDGKNVLYLNDESGERTGGKRLTAGRFDIGPEQLQFRGNVLWEGLWEAKPTGDREVTMKSQVDSKSGLQLRRCFKLHHSSSRLTITQSVTNIAKNPVRQCYWSRTFAVHGGTVVIPCDPNRSLMPNLYCMAPNGKTLDFRPVDPSIRRVKDFLVIDQPARHAKLGMDSVKGWVAYQTRQDQLFVKKYPVSDIGKYGELAGYNLSIYYPESAQLNACEIEPIGPMRELRRGEQDSFTVDWWLIPRKFPNSGKVDPIAVEKTVKQFCKMD